MVVFGSHRIPKPESGKITEVKPRTGRGLSERGNRKNFVIENFRGAVSVERIPGKSARTGIFGFARTWLSGIVARSFAIFMMALLRQLEQNGFATWVRETNSLLAYPGVLFLHTLGMGFAAGISALIDLRMLGRAPDVPLADMRKVLPYMWAGFWLNAVTGIVLFALDATTKAVSPVFYTKMGFIAMAVGVCLVQCRVFRDPFLDKRPIEIKGKILALTPIA